MSVYYNEIDPFAARWLRNLIDAGHIAPGDVDERSIKDVAPADLDGYEQCHFFAGIGGWSYALRLAGWPDDRPVWTGSCPCQPFSTAGKGLGEQDERHLWPEFYRLIRECEPATVFGEQVASKAGIAWLSRVRSNLENIGYGVGGGDIPAWAVGSSQKRHRLFFVADRPSVDWEAWNSVGTGGTATTQVSTRGLARIHVAGGRWRTDTGLDSEPTLVRNDHGLSKVLAGLGNAIVPQVAAEFIAAYMECIDTARQGQNGEAT